MNEKLPIVQSSTYGMSQTESDAIPPESQSINNTINFNMQSMMLTAQEVAPTPVTDGTSPEVLSSPVQRSRIPDPLLKLVVLSPVIGIPPTEVTHTQRVADLVHRLRVYLLRQNQLIPSAQLTVFHTLCIYLFMVLSMKWDIVVVLYVSKSQSPSGTPVTNMPSSCLNRKMSSIYLDKGLITVSIKRSL